MDGTVEFNFNTKNIILFHYPSYSGGKFVHNSLGLSDNMVFQKQSLAQAQIDGNFSFDDKKEYILTHMKDEDIKRGWWGDLRLGCSQLFGQDNWCGGGQTYDRLKEVPNVDEFIRSNEQHPSINDTVRFLSSERNDNLLFSLNWHFNELTSKNFPNAKIITFKNNTQMISHRSSFLTDEHALIQDHFWKGNCIGRVADFTWDTEWLYDVTATMNGIEELYKLFNLDGWEQAKPFVKEYYHLWHKKNYLSLNTKGIQL